MRITLLLLLVAGCAGRAEDDEVPIPRFHPAPDSALRNLPFSEAVEAAGMLYLSGQVGNLPGTTTLAPGGIEGEALLELVARLGPLAVLGECAPFFEEPRTFWIRCRRRRLRHRDGGHREDEHRHECTHHAAMVTRFQSARNWDPPKRP